MDGWGVALPSNQIVGDRGERERRVPRPAHEHTADAGRATDRPAPARGLTGVTAQPSAALSASLKPLLQRMDNSLHKSSEFRSSQQPQPSAVAGCRTIAAKRKQQLHDATTNERTNP